MDQHRYTFFGVLNGLHWPNRTTKLCGAIEHRKHTSAIRYSRVERIDRLPARIRQFLGEEYLSYAGANVGLTPSDIEKHQASDRRQIHPVLRDYLMVAAHLDVLVDPIVSQHFLVVSVDGPESESGIAQDKLRRLVADSLASIRMATSSRISIVAPRIFLDGPSYGGGVLSGPVPELESMNQRPVHIASRIDANLTRRLLRSILANPELEVVVRRLNLGAGRLSIEDRLVDLAIGLEGLYLDRAQGEMTYRLRILCAHHLGKNHVERKEIFDKVGAICKIRGSLVHANSTSLEEAAQKTLFRTNPRDALDYAESLLSQGLQRVLLESTAKNRVEYFE